MSPRMNETAHFRNLQSDPQLLAYLVIVIRNLSSASFKCDKCTAYGRDQYCRIYRVFKQSRRVNFELRCRKNNTMHKNNLIIVKLRSTERTMHPWAHNTLTGPDLVRFSLAIECILRALEHSENSCDYFPMVNPLQVTPPLKVSRQLTKKNQTLHER